MHPVMDGYGIRGSRMSLISVQEKSMRRRTILFSCMRMEKPSGLSRSLFKKKISETVQNAKQPTIRAFSRGLVSDRAFNIEKRWRISHLKSWSGPAPPRGGGRPGAARPPPPPAGGGGRGGGE